MNRLHQQQKVLIVDDAPLNIQVLNETLRGAYRTFFATTGRDALKVDVVAFCMGPPGRWSRIACLLLGSPWTYVRLVGGAEAAPGQYTALETRALLDMLA